MKRLILSILVVIILLVAACNSQTESTPTTTTTTATTIATTTTQPASFSLSNLTIEPAEVAPNEEVRVSVFVANTGGSEGIHDVVLKIKGVDEETRRPKINAGDSKKITFRVAREGVGTYAVTIEGLSGTFTVTPSPTDTTTPPVTTITTTTTTPPITTTTTTTTTIPTTTTTEAAGPPMAGEWVAQTDSGEFTFTFTINPDSTGISEFTLDFSEFYCEGVTISGSSKVTIEPMPPITGGQFTIDTKYYLQYAPDWDIVIQGMFDEIGTQAFGTWQISSGETTCASGTWTSSWE